MTGHLVLVALQIGCIAFAILPYWMLLSARKGGGNGER